MTDWTVDAPPSPTSSMIVGCLAAGVSVVGDFSDCVGECEPPPQVVVVVPDGAEVTVINSGGF